MALQAAFEAAETAALRRGLPLLPGRVGGSREPAAGGFKLRRKIAVVGSGCVPSISVGADVCSFRVGGSGGGRGLMAVNTTLLDQPHVRELRDFFRRSRSYDESDDVRVCTMAGLHDQPLTKAIALAAMVLADLIGWLGGHGHGRQEGATGATIASRGSSDSVAVQMLQLLLSELDLSEAGRGGYGVVDLAVDAPFRVRMIGAKRARRDFYEHTSCRVVYGTDPALTTATFILNFHHYRTIVREGEGVRGGGEGGEEGGELSC